MVVPATLLLLFAALMVVVPAPAAFTKPRVPFALLMAATFLLEELQVTDLVRSWVLPSVKVPVAVNCWFAVLLMVGLTGVTTMAERVDAVTVKVVLVVIVPRAALIVVVPIPMTVATPLLLASLLMVATAGTNEFQVTCDVKS